MKRALFALLLVVPVATASSQAVDVGHPPRSSPYSDLEYKHEATVFGGWYAARLDPAGVVPRGGPMAGVRYEIGVGGPVQLVGRFAHVQSERLIVNPAEPANTREKGIRPWPLFLADAGISINLTGQRSWNRIVPVVQSGIGLVSDGGKRVEDDPYRFGTTFALSLAGGVRLVPGGRFQLRADAGTWFYQIKYPAQYFGLTSDGTAVVPDQQARNFWKRNHSYTLGASYLLFR